MVLQRIGDWEVKVTKYDLIHLNRLMSEVILFSLDVIFFSGNMENYQNVRTE